MGQTEGTIMFLLIKISSTAHLLGTLLCSERNEFKTSLFGGIRNEYDDGKSSSKNSRSSCKNTSHSHAIQQDVEEIAVRTCQQHFFSCDNE